MNRESLEKLRLDRRLIKRRGWMSATERARALEALPDVSQKATTLGAAGEREQPATPHERARAAECARRWRDTCPGAGESQRDQGDVGKHLDV